MKSPRCVAAVLKVKDCPLLESLVSLLYRIDSCGMRPPLLPQFCVENCVGSYICVEMEPRELWA